MGDDEDDIYFEPTPGRQAWLASRRTTVVQARSHGKHIARVSALPKDWVVNIAFEHGPFQQDKDGQLRGATAISLSWNAQKADELAAYLRRAQAAIRGGSNPGELVIDNTRVEVSSYRGKDLVTDQLHDVWESRLSDVARRQTRCAAQVDGGFVGDLADALGNIGAVARDPSKRGGRRNR